ncbi:hypothetical protein EF918_17255 [Streptomyces sp. WAC06614]|nr:hypothetical protein EF918_17255 [Streptomyces sp. WAC06614]
MPAHDGLTVLRAGELDAGKAEMDPPASSRSASPRSDGAGRRRTGLPGRGSAVALRGVPAGVACSAGWQTRPRVLPARRTDRAGCLGDCTCEQATDHTARRPW